MSALPKAVRQQIKDAEALLAQSLQPQGPPSGEPPAGEPPAAPVAAQPPAAPVPPAPPQGDDTWEKRYRVLQGKYNAEVPALQRQAREQNDRLASLQNQLTLQQALITAPRAQAPAAAPAAPAAAKLISEDEIKKFGPDLIDLIRRAAREEYGPIVDRIKATEASVAPVRQVQQSVEELQARDAQAAQEKVETLLNAQVPNWEELNTKTEFLEWLQQSDPYAGAKRQDLLNAAMQRYDGPRVVAFFKGFLNEHAALSQPPAPVPAPAGPGTPPTLESLVAPGAPKAGPSGAPNDAGKRIWTATEINTFNLKKNQLTAKFPSRPLPPEIVAVEREIILAAREGRVRA
jgi:hypothetical protein